MIDIPTDTKSSSIPLTRQLIPYRPKADLPPPPPKTAQKHAKSSHFVSFICALFCIFALTLAGIDLAAALSRTSMADVVRRLCERVFLGCATLTVNDVSDTLPLPDTVPDTETTLPPITDTPSDTAPSDTATPSADTTPPTDATEEYAIEAADLAGSGSIHALFNETSYEPDTAALLAAALPFSDLTTHRALYGTDAPYILIIHTHGTESFAPEGADTYKTSDSFRSTDTEENIVAVGRVMAETFRRAGISVIHETEMFDLTSYSDAYSRSVAAVRRYLEKYPSIQIVLDVHRDSVIRADMTKIRPVTTVDGVQTAQFMFVIGTDFRGADHPNWQDNLTFALKVQNILLHTVPHFARSICLRGAGFNQQYTAGSLLLEVGSCGNTLTEAKRAGVLSAIAIAKVVTPGGCDLTLADILP